MVDVACSIPIEDFAKHKFWHVGLAAAFYDSNVALPVFNLEVMDDNRSWPHAMLPAFRHFLAFALKDAIRHRLDEERRSIDLLLEDMNVVGHKIGEAKQALKVKKQEKDAERLDKLPSAAEYHKAVHYIYICQLIVNSHLHSPS